jgi:hypothetical protein
VVLGAGESLRRRPIACIRSQGNVGGSPAHAGASTVLPTLMNAYFVAAAVLTFAVGGAHSVLGEVLIFSRLRAGGLVPTQGGARLREGHVRIL